MRRAKPDKPAVIAEEDLSVEETDEADEDELEDEEEAVPCVVVARLSDLQGYGDPALLRKHAERPVWFMIQDDADFMTLFDKHPERPVPPALSRSIMDVLRSFAAAESDGLQTVLGSTDAIEFGFHERASFDEVADAFADDGFDVAFVLREGKIVPDDEED